MTSYRSAQKHADTTTINLAFFTQINPVTTGVGPTYILNLMKEGTADNERTGQQILITSFLMRLHIFVNPSSGWKDNSQSIIVRISIVWDKQPNGTRADYNDIYDSEGGTSAIICEPRNVSNRMRFIILHEHECILSPTDQNTLFYKTYRRMMHETIYSGNTGTAIDIASGMLTMYIKTLSNNNFPVETLNLNFNSRITYIDKL
jgi:hypothetical protein